MLTDTASSQQDLTLRILCIVVFVAMALAVVYTAWMGITNFNRIGV